MDACVKFLHANPELTKEQSYFLESCVGCLEKLKARALELGNGKGIAETCSTFKDHNGRTVLHFASAAGREDVCKYWIEDLKLDLDMKDTEGLTPLMHALKGEQRSTTRYLLDHGANPTAVNDRGETALHCAAEYKGFKKVMRMLISKGADVDAKANLGTPLYYAIHNGRKDTARVLLDNCANPNITFHHLCSPLVLSIRKTNDKCFKLLLKSGSDPNIGSCGVTPLEAAVSEGKAEIVKSLLDAGANPNTTNLLGLTPLEVAAARSNHEIVKILLSVTSLIPTIPDWSCNGIINHIQSEEAVKERKTRAKEAILKLKAEGQTAFKREDYFEAIYWYSKAINGDPLDETVLSNRSLCWACLKEGTAALADAEACIKLKPNWPKAYYREGVAWKLLKEYQNAAESFSHAVRLDPNNNEILVAFWEAAEWAPRPLEI